MEEVKSPAKELEHFLAVVDEITREYKLAYSTVNEEDRRLQDLLHALEFAEDKAERNRMATQLQRSRRLRRRNKDMVKRCEQIVKFFEVQNNRAVLNQMRQLLGRQRKEEEYLDGERTYTPRAGKG